MHRFALLSWKPVSLCVQTNRSMPWAAKSQWVPDLLSGDFNGRLLMPCQLVIQSNKKIWHKTLFWAHVICKSIKHNFRLLHKTKLFYKNRTSQKYKTQENFVYFWWERLGHIKNIRWWSFFFRRSTVKWCWPIVCHFPIYFFEKRSWARQQYCFWSLCLFM